MRLRTHLQRCATIKQPIRVVARAGQTSLNASSGMKPASKDLQPPKDLPTLSSLEWSKPLQIVRYPDPRLRAVNAKITKFDSSLLELAKEMIQAMYLDDGVGLAAPQVGINARLMVFNPHGKEKPGNESILVNPEIVSISKSTAVETEGCLSFPDRCSNDVSRTLIYADVERPRDIIVKAQDEKGEPVQLQLGGLSDLGAFISRIFQHEYDHLQGILFHDRMKANVLDSVRTSLQALEEEFLVANPGVKIQRIPAMKVKKGF
ncbi:hypothetical protein CEUSTIGMA_g8191.t1 [Chlamydomonas eustigma]|uniref:Peptide deformylase n=1 Tax=Chlamydomonas eustigma TaxID=1157962 RepID=A0A250XCH1_9CHLO|nr:hypothetical protein CEUSTIGMA_g8191.t1 [Chlamydomonas eustigma]|eukprot:GAX80756.1 hypothetical protein CEUSTIGMA_g8191.t1 [Chlamydomonas eustigma]